MRIPWQDRLYQKQLKQRLEQTKLGWLVAFGLKQAWSCIFGGTMVFAILVTGVLTLPGLPRYDWLFIIAVVTQILLVVTKLEQPKEVMVIVLFHLTGLGMELFKTSGAIGSWNYPGEAHIRLLTVPLFSGFMYAAVGSYIARSWRVMHLRFTNYPPRWATVILGLAIYVNFFSHHYVWDFRWLLYLAVGLLYWRTRVSYRNLDKTHGMPLIVGFGLIAIVIWLAENFGTITKAWLYPNQTLQWEMVSTHKIGSWFLLMIISFIMVDLMRHKLATKDSPV